MLWLIFWLCIFLEKIPYWWSFSQMKHFGEFEEERQAWMKEILDYIVDGSVPRTSLKLESYK